MKPIEDFEGYFIVDDGRVFCNLGKENRNKDKRVAMYEIKPRVARNGYLRVYMRQTSTNKRKDMIHRLVALYFIPNPLNKNIVNHIDCNRANNKKENLEWVTHKENNDYSMKLNHLKRDVLSGRFAS